HAAVTLDTEQLVRVFPNDIPLIAPLSGHLLAVLPRPNIFAKEWILHCGERQLDEIAGRRLMLLRRQSVRVFIVRVHHPERRRLTIHLSDEPFAEARAKMLGKRRGRIVARW